MIAAAIFVSLSGNSMHSYADSGFSIQTSANPSTTDNVLQAVSAYDATHAWAVGSYRNTDGSLHDLIEYWNGTSWSVQTGANPGANGNSLSGVKALSATNIWAVGSYVDANSVTHILIEHSTDGGQTWTQDTASYTGNGTLKAIDGDPSSGDAWAVGNDSSGNALTLHLVNGHFASQTNNVTPNSYTYLYGVSEHSSSDVWAVGTRGQTSADTFTMHWEAVNGTYQWVTKTSPNALEYGNTYDADSLYGVVDIGTDDAWAVGGAAGDTSTGFLTHWNGTSWSSPTIVNLNVSNYLDSLRSIAATSSNDIWSAGFYEVVNTTQNHSLIWHSSDGGATWAQVATEFPNNSAIDNFHGITIDKNTGNIWAVGDYFPLQGGINTLIEQYTPSPTSIIQKETNPSWAGYVAAGLHGSPITFKSVTASWKVQPLQCPLTKITKEATWVGLGGVSADLEQIGVDSTCLYGVPVYLGAWETIIGTNKAIHYINIIKYPVHANDTLLASTTSLGGGKYQLVLTDSTQNWTDSIPVSASTNPAAVQTAECIVEAPSNTITRKISALANFGVYTINGCEADGKALNTWPRLIVFTMVNSQNVVMAQPSALYSDGDTFDVTWKHE